MRKRVPDEATCPICGRYFDPSESRGWCQNPSCGEWRHPSFPIDGDPDEAESPPESESTRSCPNCGNQVRADANFCGQCGKPFKESETPGDSDIATCPDCGADLPQLPSEQLAQCPICLFDLSDSDDADLKQEEITECPNCGEDLSPIPSDKRVVCPGCRVDLEQALEADATAKSPEPEETTDIETLDDIATGYVRRLRGAGITTVDDLVRADPDELSASTGISARRIRDWIETAPVEPGDSVPPDVPTESTDTVEDVVDQQDTRIQRSPKELVLEVMGQEISVTDGETVGREIRKAMVEAGAPEENAVYVHRKHVRIDVEDDSFYLTRLGENSLEINGQPVDKGNRIPIEDGDEISFSDVVTATVSVR